MKTEENSAESMNGSLGKTPPLKTIYFYLTEGCNLRCRHCWIEPKFESGQPRHVRLDVEIFRSVIGQAKHLGLATLKLSGGEPLLHPEFGEITRIVREEDLQLTVETNGTLCTPEASHAMASCRQPSVAVSLDGADAEIHEWVRGVSGSFDAAVAGIRNLVDAGIRPQVIMTVMRRNAAQLEAVIRLAESLGCGSVKFNVVQPTARGLKMHHAGETLSIEELIGLGEWVENDLSLKTRLHLSYAHPMSFRPMGRMFGRDGTGCGVCSIHGILGVLADGSYSLCGIGTTVPELVFGHAERDSLSDVWNGNAILRDIREGLPGRLHGVCGECIMKGVCQGSCIAQNYVSSRELWAPFWYCEEARNLGLFPKSRLGKMTGTSPAGEGTREKEPARLLSGHHGQMPQA